jgi:hypothetical protein
MYDLVAMNIPQVRQAGILPLPRQNGLMAMLPAGAAATPAEAASASYQVARRPVSPVTAALSASYEAPGVSTVGLAGAVSPFDGVF